MKTPLTLSIKDFKSLIGKEVTLEIGKASSDKVTETLVAEIFDIETDFTDTRVANVIVHLNGVVERKFNIFEIKQIH